VRFAGPQYQYSIVERVKRFLERIAAVDALERLTPKIVWRRHKVLELTRENALNYSQVWVIYPNQSLSTVFESSSLTVNSINTGKVFCSLGCDQNKFVYF